MGRDWDDFERLAGLGGSSMAAAMAQQQEIMKQMSGVEWLTATQTVMSIPPRKPRILHAEHLTQRDDRGVLSKSKAPTDAPRS